MVFAVLGNIVFQTLTSPQAIASSRGWTYAEHKTVESTPRLQWIAAELETIALEILLHVSFAKVAADRAALYAAAESHQALPLVMGNGTHRGWFVIAKIAETMHKLADDGSPIALGLKLELRQWARPAATAANKAPTPTAPPPAIITGPRAPGETVAGVVNPNGSVSFPSAMAGTSALLNSPFSPAPPAYINPSGVPTTQICRMDPSVGGVLG